MLYVQINSQTNSRASKASNVFHNHALEETAFLNLLDRQLGQANEKSFALWNEKTEGLLYTGFIWRENEMEIIKNASSSDERSLIPVLIS